MSQNYIENRPWGSFEILSSFALAGQPDQDVCVKKIVVKPLARLSYQSHKQRSEQWKFVQGRGLVILDGVENTVVAGSLINIPVGTKHRVSNTGADKDLIFIEISTGHFDENDIERFEDDYGRAA